MTTDNAERKCVCCGKSLGQFSFTNSSGWGPLCNGCSIKPYQTSVGPNWIHDDAGNVLVLGVTS